MATAAAKNNCKAGHFFQWDTGQVLEVYGLSLSAPPEIHFALGNTEVAEVCQTTMDAAGVIRGEVPDYLLEKPGVIYAYVCTKEGEKFSTLRSFMLPVIGRPKPENGGEANA